MKKRWICALLALALTVALLPAVPSARATEQTTDMKVSEQFIEILKLMEGFAAYAFWDNKQYTVGYGTRCPADKLDYWLHNPITEQEAMDLLYAEMPNYEIPINNFMKKYNLKLEQHQYDALVSFSYNCGSGWTGDANGYLNSAVRKGDMGSELIYGLCLWSTSGGDYILTPRRMAEANMYINGEYKVPWAENAYPSTYKHIFLDGNGGMPKYAIHGYDAADNMQIVTDFKEIPVGVDGDGNWFVYEFAGWFTDAVGGTQVTNLDGSLAKGTILYAQWKNPAGEIVPLQKGELVDNLQITVTSKLNVRTGPGTFYPVVRTINATTEAPEVVTVTEVFTSGSTTWGKTADGWLSLNYTDYDEVINALPGEPFPRPATLQRDGVNYRTEPVVNTTTLVGKLNKGEKIIIVEEKLDNGMLWGKMDNGYWICMDNKGEEYVLYDSDIRPSLVSVSMLKLPDKVQYVQMNEELSITGSVVVATYSDGSIAARTVARELTSGFDNTTLGKNTITVSYAGGSTEFEVEIIKATVVFKNYDGSILSSQQYAYGEEVTPPAGVPARPEDDEGTYLFIGWDREIAVCTGNTEYTAQYELIPAVPDYIPGDMDMNGTLTKDDVFYLLYHIVWGNEEYPVTIPADYNNDGLINKEDVFYLLYHLVWGAEEYPLTSTSN